MTNHTANLLVAFVALFDGLIGSVAWSILSYLLHRAMATPDPRDALHHQTQALLRNTSEPISFARATLMSGWRWRKLAPRALLRTVPLAVTAVLTTTLFAAAGVFSSQIASSGMVLLSTDACGYTEHPRTMNADAIYQIALNSQEDVYVKQAIDYARNCYANPLKRQSVLDGGQFSGGTGTGCDVYMSSALNWTTTLNNPCPFNDPSVCLVPESEIMKLDTGFYDSNDDLGFNFEPGDTLKMRRVNTCSPMTTVGFSNNTFYETSFEGVLHNISTYNYGVNSVQPMNYPVGPWLIPDGVTFIYPAVNYVASEQPYELRSAFWTGLRALTNTTAKAYIGYYPDDRISINKYAPVSLFFLANRGNFLPNPVEDPWFRADAPADLSNNYYDYYYGDIWASKEPGNVLGCTEQFQICNPNNGRCTDLDNWWFTYFSSHSSPARPNFTAYADIGLNEVQTVFADFLISTLGTYNFAGLVFTAGAELLDAYAQVSDFAQPLSPTLPSNQWQIEMQRLMAISNAAIQLLSLRKITGPSQPSLLAYFKHYPENHTASHTLCSSFKFKHSSYQSFSVLGLAINFTVGGVIILVALTITFVIPERQKRRSKQYQQLLQPTLSSWIANGVLHLQRVAYESIHEDIEWVDTDEDVPITKELRQFLDLGFTTRAKECDHGRTLDIEPSGFDSRAELKTSGSSVSEFVSSRVSESDSEAKETTLK